MELRHLRYFIAAAETENITRAALKLHVSQPALSRQVRDLEDELGFLLLERSAKSVRLTEAGRVFLTEARAVIQRVADGVQAARAVATGRGGEIHVGYAPSLTARILPPTLRAFQAALPGVRVNLHDLATEEMLSGLRAGRLQLSFLVKPDRGRLRGLRFEELARDSVRLALSPRHPLAQRRRVTLAEVANEPLIIYSREEYPEHYESVIALLATVKANPRVAEEHESVISLIAAVEAGTGVALVSESLSCIAGPRLKLTPLSPDPAPLVVGAAWSKQGLTSPANRFLEAAKEVAAKAMVNPEVS